MLSCKNDVWTSLVEPWLKLMFTQNSSTFCCFVCPVFKNKIYSQYRSLPRQRQNMNSLHNLILKVQKQVTPRMVAPHIKKLPAVMKLIIEKKGGPTGK